MCTVMLRGSVQNLDIGGLPNTDSSLFLYLGVVRRLDTIHVIIIGLESTGFTGFPYWLHTYKGRVFFNVTRCLCAFPLEGGCSCTFSRIRPFLLCSGTELCLDSCLPGITRCQLCSGAPVEAPKPQQPTRWRSSGSVTHRPIVFVYVIRRL